MSKNEDYLLALRLQSEFNALDRNAYDEAAEVSILSNHQFVFM